MAQKTVNMSALKPILNILEMKKQQDLKEIDLTGMSTELRKKEADNRILIGEAIDADIECINILIEKVNEKINGVNQVIGVNDTSYRSSAFGTIAKVKVPCNMAYYLESTKFEVTKMQAKEFDLQLEKRKGDIEFKYENMKAQVTLAGDYAQIKDILGAYGISLDPPVAGNMTTIAAEDKE